MKHYTKPELIKLSLATQESMAALDSAFPDFSDNITSYDMSSAFGG